jgi:hypothetical protein
VAYARQRDDSALAAWTSEIKLRACIRIGELTRELEKAHPVSYCSGLITGDKTKSETLAEAGLTTATANRCEELSGGQYENGRATADAATEAYFTKAAAIDGSITVADVGV